MLPVKKLHAQDTQEVTDDDADLGELFKKTELGDHDTTPGLILEDSLFKKTDICVH